MRQLICLCCCRNLWEEKNWFVFGPGYFSMRPGYFSTLLFWHMVFFYWNSIDAPVFFFQHFIFGKVWLLPFNTILNIVTGFQWTCKYIRVSVSLSLVNHFIPIIYLTPKEMWILMIFTMFEYLIIFFQNFDLHVNWTSCNGNSLTTTSGSLFLRWPRNDILKRRRCYEQ